MNYTYTETPAASDASVHSEYGAGDWQEKAKRLQARRWQKLRAVGYE